MFCPKPGIQEMRSSTMESSDDQPPLNSLQSPQGHWLYLAHSRDFLQKCPVYLWHLTYIFVEVSTVSWTYLFLCLFTVTWNVLPSRPDSQEDSLFILVYQLQMQQDAEGRVKLLFSITCRTQAHIVPYLCCNLADLVKGNHLCLSGSVFQLRKVRLAGSPQAPEYRLIHIKR